MHMQNHIMLFSIWYLEGSMIPHKAFLLCNLNYNISYVHRCSDKRVSTVRSLALLGHFWPSPLPCSRTPWLHLQFAKP